MESQYFYPVTLPQPYPGYAVMPQLYLSVAVCIPWARLSSINRALFLCQEPPVAMSTWQARVRAPCDYTVLMSGENQAFAKPAETGTVKTLTQQFRIANV